MSTKTIDELLENVNQRVAEIIEERNEIRAALRAILNEAEFVGDAKAPFSTWVAERARAALNTPKNATTTTSTTTGRG